jgi:hypothetical protein
MTREASKEEEGFIAWELRQRWDGGPRYARNERERQARIAAGTASGLPDNGRWDADTEEDLSYIAGG